MSNAQIMSNKCLPASGMFASVYLLRLIYILCQQWPFFVLMVDCKSYGSACASASVPPSSTTSHTPYNGIRIFFRDPSCSFFSFWMVSIQIRPRWLRRCSPHFHQPHRYLDSFPSHAVSRQTHLLESARFHPNWAICPAVPEYNPLLGVQIGFL